MVKANYLASLPALMPLMATLPGNASGTQATTQAPASAAETSSAIGASVGGLAAPSVAMPEASAARGAPLRADLTRHPSVNELFKSAALSRVEGDEPASGAREFRTSGLSQFAPARFTPDDFEDQAGRRMLAGAVSQPTVEWPVRLLRALVEKGRL